MVPNSHNSFNLLLSHLLDSCTDLGNTIFADSCPGLIYFVVRSVKIKYHFWISLKFLSKILKIQVKVNILSYQLCVHLQNLRLDSCLGSLNSFRNHALQFTILRHYFPQEVDINKSISLEEKLCLLNAALNPILLQKTGNHFRPHQSLVHLG